MKYIAVMVCADKGYNIVNKLYYYPVQIQDDKLSYPMNNPKDIEYLIELTRYSIPEYYRAIDVKAIIDINSNYIWDDKEDYNINDSVNMMGVTLKENLEQGSRGVFL